MYVCFARNLQNAVWKTAPKAAQETNIQEQKLLFKKTVPTTELTVDVSWGSQIS